MANELFDALSQLYREVIKPDFDDIREKMATRADLEAVRSEMATKADLQAIRAEMATKADLQAVRDEMATNADLQAIRDEMATKSDLQAVERGVQAELQAIRREMVTWPVLVRFHELVIRPEVDDVRAKLADLATRDERSRKSTAYTSTSVDWNTSTTR